MSINRNNYNNNEEMNQPFFEMQIGTYLYYVITVMNFFEKEPDESTFQKCENSGNFDELTKAHHLLGFYPRLAEKIITAFREEHGMENIYSSRNQMNMFCPK